ncbi:uncharacterized protein LOC123526477 [Mercenaria mercenaria]|uniref:uncharacterized protein LOC123526477 n=1 Tax=Mercenaria mercenaria TaxID=6596 RepID=UPI00234EA10A|nr:uncharacterized protein LOC123526477 [Mercenaria mercenaria]
MVSTIKKPEAENKQLLKQVTSGGDSKENSKEQSPKQVNTGGENKKSSAEHLHKQNKLDGANKENSTKQSPKQAKPSGDNEIDNNGQTVSFSVLADISATGDDVHSGASSSKNQTNGDKIEKQVEDAEHRDVKELPSAKSAKKVVKKKKNTDFKVKPAADDQTDCPSNKNGEKEKIRQQKEGDVPKQKRPKEKVPKEKKDVKSKEPKMTLPVRSLTDEEYSSIFEAAIENAMNLNIDEWVPKVTSPVKVKEPTKKKYGITVGKKVSKSTDQKIPQHCQESCPKQDVQIVGSTEVEEIDKHGHGKSGDVEEHIDENNLAPEEEGEIDEADEEIVVGDIDEVEPVQESAQQENETTPVGSEVDVGEKQPCVTTPIKKKKLPKVNKNPKLEPKQLPFEGKSKISMVDKVKQMKKIKKDKQEVRTKKRKLDHEMKKHTSEKVERKQFISLEDGKRKKPSEKKINKRQKMQDRELETNGTWVQCCNCTCMKWRYLPDISDPTLIPERWTCSMNLNKECNSCDKAEEVYDESEHIYTKFAEGSVVWAKMTGYPWWPAMVEIDPDAETFFSIDSDDSMIPTHYHVVFFDEHVSRTWVKADHVKMFTGSEENDGILYQVSKKRSSYKKDITVAKKNALRALSCTIKERIELFGFAARYKGPWSSKCKADKHKNSKHTPRQKSTDVQEAYLDDSTMDEVLENTEALLDNVEEMLDSLNSQIDDSDADSDFVPDELVIVETKRKDTARKSSVGSPGTSESGRKKVKFSKLNSETDIATSDNTTRKEKQEQRKTNKNIKSEVSKEGSTVTVAKMSLKLDSDIFTMEMNSQDDNFIERHDAGKDSANEINKKSANNITNKVEKKEENEYLEHVPKSRANTKKRKEKGQSECDQPKVKVKKQKKIKGEEVGKPVAGTVNDLDKDAVDNLHNLLKHKVSNENDINNNKQKFEGQNLESNNHDNSMKQVVVEEDVLNQNERKVNEQEDSKSHAANSVEEFYNNTDKGENEKVKDCDGNKCDIEAHYKDIDAKEFCSQSKKETGSDTEAEVDLIEKDDKNNESNTIEEKGEKSAHMDHVSHYVGLDDEIDLNEIENDAVPDLDRIEANVGYERNPGQSLEDASDSEFDLEEHYMYETVTDGSDKVRERGALNAQSNVAEIDEDSDPFDLMEE